MIRWFLLIVGLCLFSSTGRAGEAFFVPVHGIDKVTGALVFREVVAVTRLRDVPVNTVVDGKVVVITVRENVVDRVEKPIKYPFKDFKIYDGLGNLVAADEAVNKLKPGTVLLVANRGDKVNPLILFSLRRETLILVGGPKRIVPNPAPAAESNSAFLTMVDELMEKAIMLGVKIAVQWFGE